MHGWKWPKNVKRNGRSADKATLGSASQRNLHVLTRVNRYARVYIYLFAEHRDPPRCNGAFRQIKYGPRHCRCISVFAFLTFLLFRPYGTWSFVLRFTRPSDFALFPCSCMCFLKRDFVSWGTFRLWEILLKSVSLIDYFEEAIGISLIIGN